MQAGGLWTAGNRVPCRSDLRHAPPLCPYCSFGHDASHAHQRWQAVPVKRAALAWLACFHANKVPLCAVHPHRRHLLAACRALPQPEAVASFGIDAAPLDPNNADAIADLFPDLQDLMFHAAYDSDAEDTIVAGAVRLLTRCGPRLTHLNMNVCGWTPPCLVHLRSCTALTSLELRLSHLSTAQPNEGGMCQRGG